MTINDKSYLYI